VQGLDPGGRRARAPRRLAVDGDDLAVLIGCAQPRHPRHEGVAERLAVERGDHRVDRVVGRNALTIGQKAAQERDVQLAPTRDLREVVGPGHHPAQHQQQDLGQRIDHLGALARILQRGITIENINGMRLNGHGSLRRRR